MTVTCAADGSLVSGHPMARGETDRSAALPSFSKFYHDYFDFVWACARRMGVREDEIDDVVQEIFLVVHARLSTVQQPASLRSWVYGVIRRTVSNNRRQRQSQTSREFLASTLDDNVSHMLPSPLDLAILNDKVKLLWRLLEQLSARKREVLILAELEQMTAPEIAGAVGIPLDTAYSRLRAARQDFSDAYARCCAAEKWPR